MVPVGKTGGRTSLGWNKLTTMEGQLLSVLLHGHLAICWLDGNKEAVAISVGLSRPRSKQRTEFLSFHSLYHVVSSWLGGSHVIPNLITSLKSGLLWWAQRNHWRWADDVAATVFTWIGQLWCLGRSLLCEYLVRGHSLSTQTFSTQMLTM